MSDLDAPPVPDRAEDRLLVVPSDATDLDVVVPAEGVMAGTTTAATGRPVTSTATTRLVPLVRP